MRENERQMQNDVMEFEPTLFSGSILHPNDIRLSLSENPYKCSPRVIEALYAEIERIHYYPDSAYTELRNEIAGRYNLNPEMVVLGNGTDELIFMITLLVNQQKNKVITTEKTFGGYKYSSMITKRTLVEFSNDEHTVNHICHAIDEDTAIVFLCNPHNPLGTCLNYAELCKIAAACNRYDALLVIDEAYIEYTQQEHLTVGLMDQYDNILILRTFSKAYGLAGIRCGYALTNNQFKQLNQIRNALPYNLNRLACAAALAAFRDVEYLQYTVKESVKVKIWFYKQLDKLEIAYIPSSTNFVTIKMRNSKVIVEQMYTKFNIIIRELVGFGYDDHIRISLGTMDQMIRTVEALQVLHVQMKGQVKDELECRKFRQVTNQGRRNH